MYYLKNIDSYFKTNAINVEKKVWFEYGTYFLECLDHNATEDSCFSTIFLLPQEQNSVSFVKRV